MKERYVLEALQKAVIAATSSLTISIKYIGRTFAVPSNDKWLEVVYIPNNIENQYWDESKTYRGIMRLVLHWPIDDKGAYPALDFAKLIADGFTKGDKVSDLGENVAVTITEEPNIQGVLEQAPELLIPITIRYNYFST